MNRTDILRGIASKCSPEEQEVLQSVLEEKTAAADVPWYRNDEFIAKLANEYSMDEIGEMAKEAAKQDELDKIAADYDTAGRIQARGAHDEWTKLGFYEAVHCINEAVAELKELLSKQAAPVTRNAKLNKLAQLLAQ